MLSRISTALAQLVKPVSSAPESPKDIGRENPRHQQGQFQRFQKPASEKSKPADAPEAPNAKVLPFPGKAVVPAQVSKPGTPSVAHSFLELLQLLNGRRGKVLSWIGARAYRNTATQGRKGRFAKGAMIDQKAE